ncbi:MAG: hypothetical protein ACLQGV_02100 [Bryobacteraceae bacterium]
MYRKSRLLIIALTTVLACRVVCAQHVHPQSSSGATAQLPVLVDGSKTPDQIPDALAYQHYFMAVAAHPSPSAQEQSRQDAQLLPLQLSAADQQALILRLASFRTQLDQLENNLANSANATPAPSTPSQLASPNAQQAALATAALAGLRQSLTPDGASRLDQYVQTRVKAHIVIYGTPK